jgi:pantetheine-phosphate adenylyltransferase
MKTAIYPGTFDPIHKGHVDLVERASKLFDKVIVAIADSKKKQPMFSLEERIDICLQSLSKLDNIEVCGFDHLIVDFAKSKDSHIVLRGLRTTADFEYELQMANMNRAMSNDFETVFLTPNERFSSISSSLVREISTLGGDVEQFVPPPVYRSLMTKLNK